MSSSFVVSLSSFNLLFFTQVLTVLTSTLKYNDYVTDKGKNVSIPCLADGDVMWVKEDVDNSTIVQAGKLLVLTNVSTADRGLYVCFAAVPVQRNISAILQTATTMSPAKLTTTTTTTITTAASTTSPLPVAGADDVAASHNSTTASATATTTPVQQPQQKQEEQTTVIPPQQSQPQPQPPVEDEELVYEAMRKINLIVRTPPGPVTQLYFKASTILGFLVWRFNKTNSGGYPVRSFTAEFRNISYEMEPFNSSYEHQWSRMDPINIAPNVRQMEVYRLEPNTTYEFRIWANNVLGSGPMVTTNVTTLPETKEEDLIRLIQPDLDNFDPRIWIAAVSVVLGTLVILALGLCIVLSKECYQSSQMAGVEDGWDSIELIPNIILNPGFCETDGSGGAPGGLGRPYTRTVIFGCDDDDSYESESDHEPRMEKFKRKVSVFFTGPGPSIKRI